MTALTTLQGHSIELDEGLGALADRLRGDLLRPDDAGYDEARALWNGMTVRRPAAIAHCADSEDVRTCVRFAAAHDLLLAVRGGGHNVAGTAGADGALVIDLSAMNDVEVDAGGRRARAGGGATFADLDAATQRYGLAAPGGVVSATGIGGLTLSGGIGWLRRKHGLTCDNLVAATLVAADGTVHHVDEERDPELLWGLRGGGGNFGVVTELTYRLHPVGPEVFLSFTVYPLDAAEQVLGGYRDWTDDLAEEVTSLVVGGSVPEEPDIPEEHWGEPCVILVACAATELDRGEELTQPIRHLAEPIADLSGPVPYVALQQLFDADYPDGLRYYWRSLHLPALSDEVVARTIAWTRTRPSARTTVDLWHLGGAMARPGPEATAYGDRSAPFLLGVESNWEDPADDDANLAWTRSCVDAFEELSTGREYLNFPGLLEDREATLRAAHGEANLDRLRALKQRMDPDNRFRLHQNIPPS
ncbi:MAG: FAD-binding oxidoreductase [Nitriliruptor sp.]|nr:MAG: FAD-binding oxidoreductase [Nitriliruptor sp.]